MTKAYKKNIEKNEDESIKRVHTYRTSDDVYAKASEKAWENKTTVSKLIDEFLNAYIKSK